MANGDETERPENWDAIGGHIGQGIIRELMGADFTKWAIANGSESLAQILAVVIKLVAPIGVGLARGIASAEDDVAPELAEIAAAAVSDVFNIDIPPSVFSERHNRPGRNQASDALGRELLKILSPATTSLEPGDAAARKYLSFVVNMSLEGWYQGWMFEYMSSLIPYFDVLKIEKFAGLDDKLIGALGLERLSRRVLAPLVDATIATPMEWHVNKTYRPALLTPAQAARQIHRGRGTPEKWLEEMRRAGLSEDRIEAIISEQQKFLSVEQLSWLEWNGIITRDEAVQSLREQGYDEQIASKHLNIREFERTDTINRRVANDALTAYEKRDIDASQLRGILGQTIGSPKERDLLVVAADARRALNTANLGLGDVEKAVRMGILAYRDYRAALERAGYVEADQIVLELILRGEIQKDVDAAEHRRQLERERAEEKERRRLAAELRARELAAERALRRRGPESDLERAAIIGLIPFARYEEVIRPLYDGDTVNILVDLVEVGRQNYLAQLAAAEAARQRALRRDIDVGSLEQAVMNDVLSLAEYSREIALRGFDAADVGILTSTLREKKKDRDDALAKRAAAELAAKNKSIDLGRFEYLVRRGRRTLNQYDALVASLGFDVGARAALRELLQLRIDDDRAAAAALAEAEEKLRNKGVSLEQMRRAVILGNTPIEAYGTLLAKEGFTANAQALLVANLRDELEEADAARRARARELDATGARVVPLASVRRAVQLGVVDFPAYTARLVKAGYGPDAVDLELELLVTEVSEAKLRAHETAAARAAAELRALNLGQLAEAVERGLKTLQEYADDLSALGYLDQDVALLVALLVLRLDEQEEPPL